jgi:hypothetical protein
LTLTPYPSPFQGEGSKEGEKMNTQTESKPVVTTSEATIKAENPMQERLCGQVEDSVEVAAEAVFTARRSEMRGETGPIFVP